MRRAFQRRVQRRHNYYINYGRFTTSRDSGRNCLSRIRRICALLVYANPHKFRLTISRPMHARFRMFERCRSIDKRERRNRRDRHGHFSDNQHETLYVQSTHSALEAGRERTIKQTIVGQTVTPPPLSRSHRVHRETKTEKYGDDPNACMTFRTKNGE